MFSLNDGLLFERLDDPKLCAVIEGSHLVDLWTADNSISGRSTDATFTSDLDWRLPVP